MSSFQGVKLRQRSVQFKEVFILNSEDNYHTLHMYVRCVAYQTTGSGTVDDILPIAQPAVTW